MDSRIGDYVYGHYADNVFTAWFVGLNKPINAMLYIKNGRIYAI